MNGLTGVVLAYEDQQRFGFIAGVDGRRYFAHREEIVGCPTLAAGERVAFDACETPRGPAAFGIVKLFRPRRPTSTPELL
jgi:cold shock CspA family protein